VDEDDLVLQYRELLSSEASIASTRSALRLVEEVGSLYPSQLDQDTTDQGESPMLFLRDYVQEFAAPLESDAAARRAMTANRRKLAKLAGEVARRLSEVPHVLSHKSTWPSARGSFFLDTAFLFAHHAYFGLLSHLDDHGPRASVLQSLEYFGQWAIWYGLPSDGYRLLGLVREAVEHHDEAIKCFRGALAATRMSS
jgi:hypothetical protein